MKHFIEKNQYDIGMNFGSYIFVVNGN